MSRRIPVLVLTVVLSFFASLMVAMPASATQLTVGNEAAYTPNPIDGNYPNGASSTALSDSGHRVLAVLAPTDTSWCTDGLSQIELRAGLRLTNPDRVQWQDALPVSASPYSGCASVIGSKVFLSSDGSSGFAAWYGVQPGGSLRYASVVHFTWGPNDNLPSVEQVTSLAYGTHVYSLSGAMAADGSRLALEWQENTNQFLELADVKYSVIEADAYPNHKVYTLPVQTNLIGNELPVAVSDDGEQVVLSFATLSGGDIPIPTFSMSLLSCTVFCSVSKLKTSAMTIPSSRIPVDVPTFKMNGAGNRLVMSWMQAGTGGLALLALNPKSMPTDFLNKVKYYDTIHAGRALAMNRQGTQLAFFSRNFDFAPVVTASNPGSTASFTLDNSLKFSTPKVTSASGKNLANFSIVTDVAFVNDSAGVAKQLLVAATTYVDGNPRYGLYISDSATAPSNWATVQSIDTNNYYGGRLSTSRSAPTFVTVIDKQFLNTAGGQPTIYSAVLKKVISVTRSPKLVGAPTYNKTVTLDRGAWAGATLPARATWARCGNAMDPQPGGLSYAVTLDNDMGCALSATFSVSRAGYYTNTVTLTTAAMSGKPIRMVLNLVDATGPNGTPVGGNTLSYSLAGTYPLEGVNLVLRQWKVGTRVVGNDRTYVVQPGDVGKKISLTIKISLANWATTSMTVTTPAVIAAGR